MSKSRQGLEPFLKSKKVKEVKRPPIDDIANNCRGHMFKTQNGIKHS